MNIFLKKIFFIFIIFLLIFSATPTINSEGLPETFRDLADELLPGVVNISTTQIIKDRYNNRPEFQFPPGSPFEDMFRDFFDTDRNNRPKTRKATSLGSGFVIDESGYIVTNNHVIGDADQIEVVFQDETKLKAELIGKDSKVDIAVLKVKTKKN